MPVNDFHCRCIYDILDGLREGLSLFSGTSRVAMIYAVAADDPLRVCDPQGLLDGHQPRFRELFVDSGDWRLPPVAMARLRRFDQILTEKDLGLAGRISFGGRSASMYYQMWFTEHHPDMCAVGPTGRWLEHAVYRLSHDVANAKELYTGISGAFLREYATHAVRDFIIDEMGQALGMDTRLRIYPILDAVLGISRTLEEGAWARGKLMFVEPSAMQSVVFAARFPEAERPLLDNFKHVRKLLTSVEFSPRILVSDGRAIVGIARGAPPRFNIVADFRGGYGLLRLNGEKICSFANGRFLSTTHRAKLVQVEEILLESRLDPEVRDALFKTINDIVHTAESGKYGCTLVIDLNRRPVSISGQRLEAPLDLRAPENLSLAQSLAKVDGALHIGADVKLHAFACLLDGRAIAGEDRARGARYNSALRFTAARPGLMIVVVSSDRPVSVIQEGVELSAHCPLDAVSACVAVPPTLERWVAGD
ncbi:MAG: DNA integrity scanning protein DisA nucleotide-binding domain protein [Pseudomonadota bacterium]